MVRPGRKQTMKRMSRLDLMIGSTQKEALIYVAVMANVTMSSIVEMAVIEYLQKYYQKMLSEEGINIE